MCLCLASMLESDIPALSTTGWKAAAHLSKSWAAATVKPQFRLCGFLQRLLHYHLYVQTRMLKSFHHQAANLFQPLYDADKQVRVRVAPGMSCSMCQRGRKLVSSWNMRKPYYRILTREVYPGEAQVWLQWSHPQESGMEDQVSVPA